MVRIERRWNPKRGLWLALLLPVLWLTVTLYREEMGQRLIDALWRDDARAVRTLLVWGADPNAGRDRKDKFRGLLKLLLDGMSPEEQRGWSCLMIAALNRRDDPEPVKLLLAHGARVNARGWMEAAPLTHAAEAGSVEIAAALLQRGAAVNQPGAFGQTALMIAAGAMPMLGAGDARPAQMVRLLLDAGADVNAQNYRGQTALMFAARQGRPEIAAMLLARGADTSLRDRDGHTARDYAEQSGNRRVTALYGKK